ncbi:MAG TPA: hypothetical protein GXZ82_05715 [Firmicutes bacterium]|nr:hypothetical protein [Bacillota bacterium]
MSTRKIMNILALCIVLFALFTVVSAQAADGNLVLNKPVTTSFAAAGNPGSNAVDNSASTHWRVGVTEGEIWLIVDLGRPMPFDSYKLEVYGYPYMRGYKFQYSDDGENWSDAMEKIGEVLRDEAGSFPPVTARYVRYEALRNDIKTSAVGLRNFELYYHGEPVLGQPAVPMTPKQSVLMNGEQVQQADFFAPAIQNVQDLSADKIYPQGRIFPFGGYSGVALRDKANYFTLHGPVYGDANHTMLANAEAADMYAIYTVGIPINFLEATGGPATDLTPEQIAAEIKRQVTAVVDNNNLAWWYVMPEELRPWRSEEMQYLDIVTRTIRENDPQGRPIWMYDPGHRTYTNLSLTAQYLDILGKGMYTNYSGQLEHRIWVRWTLEQQLQALELKGRPGAIPIGVPEMFQEPSPQDVEKIPSWVRHDVYLALVCGAKGIVVFSLGQRSGFSQSSWQAYYDAYAQTALELNGERQLGQVFLFGEPRHDLQLTITSGEKIVSPRQKTGVIDDIIPYDSVSMANIAYGTDRYLFLVNSSEEPVEVLIEGFPEETFYVRDAFTGDPLPSFSAAVTLTLPGLGVKGFQLTQGYANIMAPQHGTTLVQPQIPVEISTPGLSLRTVQVSLDGAIIYEGTALPANLVLQTAELAIGNHQLVVVVTDDHERTYTSRASFDVEHLRITYPEQARGTALKGVTVFTLHPGVAPTDIQSADIHLVSIVNGERQTVHQLYSGISLPSVLEVDTTQFTDGAYELEINLSLKSRLVTSYVQRLVIDNWDTLEDPLLPPTTSAWFGNTDQLKAFDRSEGWEFTGATPELFYGDTERMRRRAATDEYVIWRLPGLQRFEFTFYIQTAKPEQQITISVSADGTYWSDTLFTLQEVEHDDRGWSKVLVEGIVPSDVLAEYIRLTLSGDGVYHNELGNVFLVGRK